MLSCLQQQKSFEGDALDFHVSDPRSFVKVDRLVDWAAVDSYWPWRDGSTGKPLAASLAIKKLLATRRGDF